MQFLLFRRVCEKECGRCNGGFVRKCVGAAMVFVHFCEKIQKNVQSLVHKQGKIRKMYKEPASKEPAPKYTIPKESLCVTIYLTSLAGALPPEKMTGTELYSII